MKTVLSLLLFCVSGANAGTDFFNPFLGEYSITQRQCFRNDEASDECFNDVIEIKLGYDGSVLRIYDIAGDGKVGYPLYEKDYKDDFGFSKAVINSANESTATWALIERFRQFAGPELTELDEYRTLSQSGDNVIYEFFRREKSPFTSAWSVRRVFVLKKNAQ